MLAKQQRCDYCGKTLPSCSYVRWFYNLLSCGAKSCNKKLVTEEKDALAAAKAAAEKDNYERYR